MNLSKLNVSLDSNEIGEKINCSFEIEESKNGDLNCVLKNIEKYKNIDIFFLKL